MVDGGSLNKSGSSGSTGGAGRRCRVLEVLFLEMGTFLRFRGVPDIGFDAIDRLVIFVDFVGFADFEGFGGFGGGVGAIFLFFKGGPIGWSSANWPDVRFLGTEGLLIRPTDFPLF